MYEVGTQDPYGGVGIIKHRPQSFFLVIPTCAIAHVQINIIANIDPNNSLVIGNSFCFFLKKYHQLQFLLCDDDSKKLYLTLRA